MIHLSEQTVQHVIDLLKEDWETGDIAGDGLQNEGEKMIAFLEKKLEEK